MSAALQLVTRPEPYTILPGRVAMMVDPDSWLGHDFELPAFVRQRLCQQARGRKSLKRATVWRSGIRELREGDEYWIMPAIAGGLVIEHGDRDHPLLAAEIPKGRELWIYSKRSSWEDQILLRIDK